MGSLTADSVVVDGELPRGGGIYLICFDRPLAHARHYLGYAGDLQRRIARHRAGNGSRLLAAVGRAGIGWRVVRFWPGADRRRERQLHRARCSPRLCPACRERAKMLR